MFYLFSAIVTGSLDGAIVIASQRTKKRLSYLSAGASGPHNLENHIEAFLRAKAECFARLCHRLGVCPSVRLSVCHTREQYQNGARNLHCGLPQGL